MAQVMNIHTFRQLMALGVITCMHLSFVNKPIFSPSSQRGANRLSLVPLDDLELCYPNRYIGNMEFWFIQDGVSDCCLHNALQSNHDG